jgi:hypothetical protein
MVRAIVEARMGPDGTTEDRWRHFAGLLASPRLPSGLRVSPPAAALRQR